MPDWAWGVAGFIMALMLGLIGYYLRRDRSADDEVRDQVGEHGKEIVSLNYRVSSLESWKSDAGIALTEIKNSIKKIEIAFVNHTSDDAITAKNLADFAVEFKERRGKIDDIYFMVSRVDSRLDSRG